MTTSGQNILNRLIEQAKSPRGFLGSIMLGIMNRAHEGMNRWALELNPVQAGSVILDVGCGGGRAIQNLSRINPKGKICGIDYSHQAVTDSIRNNKEKVEQGIVEIRQASVSEVPYSKEYFDLITAFQTHYFWPDLEHDISELHRVLKPSGQLMIVSEQYKMNYHMKNYESQHDMLHLLERSGFRDVSVFEKEKRGWLCFLAIK
ncbi:class I SAM-dependent methyltransferase [Paenibacillus illinoisensis]|uniref:SAM-dependent methyltransferase n=1 Tax=Paenibacillus illinoisensis TaxID=59845 RepID=A0A2W0CAS6_9BACL|nr:class I SAM-dependent methyltransferase [Paenibacillus illinoisensis]PYY29790.1 SAM-dependent methyltransferase [Paenibacillus illinoisensis]